MEWVRKRQQFDQSFFLKIRELLEKTKVPKIQLFQGLFELSDTAESF
jgi:hypothetical protein